MPTIVDQVMKIRKPKPKYPILRELSDRFSPRHYANEQIPIADIHSILEAARWVPSGRNARQMGIFNKEKVKQIIKAKDQEEPFVIIVLGRLGNYAKASEDIIQRDMTSTPRKTDFAKKI